MGFQLPGQTRSFLAVLKKTLVADYEQLLRAFFSCFQCQKNILNLFWKYFSICTKQLHSLQVRFFFFLKLGSILIWVKIGYSHTIECVWERRTFHVSCTWYKSLAATYGSLHTYDELPSVNVFCLLLSNCFRPCTS